MSSAATYLTTAVPSLKMRARALAGIRYIGYVPVAIPMPVR